MNYIKTLLIAALAAAYLPSCALAMECPASDVPGTQRQLVVISDLHFGVGRQADGRWDPTEDFRWTKALQGFLRRIADCGKDAVDLVIAGDAFELWQPPANLECVGVAPDAGCTPAALRLILANAIAAHTADLEAIGRFADRGANHVYFVPGNHDAALVLDACWQLVAAAVAARPGRVTRVANGLFVSADGRILVEHGHQIGEDVNAFSTWPTITRSVGGNVYVHKPWGERFVQVLFNKQEGKYPTIDNLSPESAGVRYRIADKGAWASVGDVARFIKFNLFETAMSQKLKVLGADADPSTIPPWDLGVARGWGHLLFARALPADDPFRVSLLADTPEAGQLRDELDAMARDPVRLPDTDVRQLCDLVAIQSEGRTRCLAVQLGAVGEALLVSKKGVLIDHLRKRTSDSLLRDVRVFVYAHTHLYEVPRKLTIPGGAEVVVANTGAFQRVIDDPAFVARAKAKGLTPAEALRRFEVEDLAPCYTAVVVPMRGGLLEPVLVRWHMDENAAGEFVLAGDAACN
jgi:UDP-2,3-diacylglucosamine pyrophosphatase LpxH